MKSFYSRLLQIGIVLLMIGNQPTFACPDPCPNVNWGDRFREAGMVFWDKKYSEDPERKGVASY